MLALLTPTVAACSRYIRRTLGRDVDPATLVREMRFLVGPEGIPPEPMSQNPPYALARCEEQTIYAIRWVPVGT